MHIAEEPRKENGGELGARPADGSSGPCWCGVVVLRSMWYNKRFCSWQLSKIRYLDVRMIDPEILSE